MSIPLRPLALAAVFSLVAGGSAIAQTVILKGAKPGETVEVAVNGTAANTGKVAADGTATVAGNIPVGDTGRPEMDARLYLDACDASRRVHIVNRSLLPPPPAAGCARTEVAGIYWVRQRSTIVIDVAGAIPDVLLRQGTYNPNAPSRRLAPAGLHVFGGGGLAKTSEAAAIACGDVGECGDDGYVIGFNVGASMWITRWLGVEGSYLRPTRMSAEGSGVGGNFSFTSTLDLDIVNLVVKAGAPLGPVRLYGQGGTTYHEGTTTMEETIGGASQTVETRTDGWSYTFGGGLEAWISDRLALYGEFGRTKIKGRERLSGVIDIDDQLTHYMFGVRFRVF